MVDNTGKLEYEERGEGKDLFIYLNFGGKRVVTSIITSKPLLRSFPNPIVTDEEISNIKASIDRINEELKVVASHNPVSR